MNAFDVIVIGGGIVGLSAAIAMQQRNFSVAVIDAGALTIDTDLAHDRVYAINLASQRLLENLGVWPSIAPDSAPYRHMHVWDASNHAHIDFDARMVGTDQLGVIAHDSIIKQALLAKAHALDLALYANSRITNLHSNDDGVTLSNSTTTWHTKLLMVADGANSTTRDLLGVAVTTWPYHQHAITTTIATEKAHLDTAYQVFTADGPLAFLPLTDPHQCSIVWSSSPARAQALLALNDEEFADQLTDAFEAKLGQNKVLSARRQYPLHMRHTQSYSGPNWLLMGDAAHTIHPLAGLGLNVGLADLAAWLELIQPHKKMAWSNTMLRAYQRQRKHAVWKTIALMGGLKTLFANPLPPIVGLRGFGLNACDKLSPLKRMFIEHAAG